MLQISFGGFFFYKIANFPGLDFYKYIQNYKIFPYTKILMNGLSLQIMYVNQKAYFLGSINKERPNIYV